MSSMRQLNNLKPDCQAYAMQIVRACITDLLLSGNTLVLKCLWIFPWQIGVFLPGDKIDSTSRFYLPT